jgi:hypothetical protein
MADPQIDGAFIMRGAREALAGGMSHIEEQINGIERAVSENPSLAFDLAKTLIESVCRTILTERGIQFKMDDDLPRLFKTVASGLPLLPVSASGGAEVRKSLAQTLKGLHTTIQGVCELRNQCGFASHGADSTRPAMESAQALLAAEAADAIVGFLQRIHRQDRQPSVSPHKEYAENADFNSYVDELHGVIRVFEAEFKPSEVLFQMEPETYRVYLAEFEPEAEKKEDMANQTGTKEE